MAKSFQIKLSEPPNELIAQARETALRNGVNFSGDSASGAFSGYGIEGAYRVEEDMLVVTIFKKPLIIPWTTIESKMKSFFS